MKEFETRLRSHAKNVISSIAPPFEIESEDMKMIKKHDTKRILILAAAVICLLAVTAVAAYHIMNAEDAAMVLGDEKLSDSFEGVTPYATVTDGEYKATVLGVVSGKELSSLELLERPEYEKTYIAVAVEKADGSPMTWEDSNSLMVTPLIQGFKPWQLNIASMNGGYTADIIDGVLYCIIEGDTVEYFADRKVYVAVLSDAFVDNTSYAIDGDSGEISSVEDYDGTNILIELDMDESKANTEKAEEYIKSLGKMIS